MRLNRPKLTCCSPQALHGTAEIPEDFRDSSEPDFVEAARWLARQKDHYLRQKLLHRRVRLLNEALGEPTMLTLTLCCRCGGGVHGRSAKGDREGPR